MRDPLLVARYDRHLDRLVGAGRARDRTARAREAPGVPGAGALLPWTSSRDVRAHLPRPRTARTWCGAFRKHRDAGKLEIITCGATHGFLPLMDAVPQAVRAQVQVGVAALPRASWAPTRGASGCPSAATCPGHERFLHEAGLALQLPRVARPHRRRPAARRTACCAPILSPGRHRVLRARPGVLAPGVERRGRLSRRLRLPRVLPRRRLGAAARPPGRRDRPTACARTSASSTTA